MLSAGLTHTPKLEKGEVSFNLNDIETFLPYTKALKDFLAKYDDETQRDQMKYEDCGGMFHSDILLALLSPAASKCRQRFNTEIV